MKNKRSAFLLSISTCAPFSIIFEDNMNYYKDETSEEIENPDDDEDLRRFLRGGFGAK